MRTRRSSAPVLSCVLSCVLSLGLATFAVSTARACPNCKEALSLQPEEAARMSSGFNWSVLFMLSVPASLLGTGAFAVRRAVRKGILPEM